MGLSTVLRTFFKSLLENIQQATLTVSRCQPRNYNETNFAMCIRDM